MQMYLFAILVAGCQFYDKPLEVERKSERDPAQLKRLEEAFGKESKELQAPIVFEYTKQGLILAAKEAILERDGKLPLNGFSIARTGKEKGTALSSTIIRSDSAQLRFDRPLQKVLDIFKGRIRSAELAGGIHITLAEH